MAGRGGDQRELSSPDGRDLLYARLLFDALWCDDSAEGKEFSKDYESLYSRWNRLAVVIVGQNESITPVLKDTDRDLDNLEWHYRGHEYPKPRPLTPEEHACLEWRQAIARDACAEIYANLGRPLQRPQDWNGSQEPWRTWEDVCRFLNKWVKEPAYNANRHIKLKRWRRRPMIVKYRQEVAAFCDRWRLRAWWAVPAIIQHHFFRAEHESFWDPTIPPLSMHVLVPYYPIALPVTVKLPGRTDEQFERDKAATLDHAETTTIQSAGGPIQVVRSHFSLEEHSDWETSNDSSCVRLDWDGRRHLLQSFAPLVQITPGEFMVERCQQRLGRPLKYREARQVRSQVASQLNRYRRILGDAGWFALGDSDREVVAAVVARVLLRPSTSWSELTSLEQIRSGDRYLEFQNLRRACREFSDSANLTLPKRSPGKSKHSSNIEH